MSDDESNIKETINAVSGLVEKVPIYQDAVQPLAKEVGKALGTVGETVNAALMPIRGLIWSFEQIGEFVHSEVSKKLEKIPLEDIQTPDLAVAGPAIESLRFTGHKEELAEMYANLLATSMDKNTAKTAHPGFVEIIRNLSGDEAKILSFLIRVKFVPIVDIRRKSSYLVGETVVSTYVTTIGLDAGCEHQELIGTYLKNLERLGLIDILRDEYLAADGVYDRILNDPSVKKLEEELNTPKEDSAEFKKYHAEVSEWGKLFIAACVNSRDKTEQSHALGQQKSSPVLPNSAFRLA